MRPPVPEKCDVCSKPLDAPMVCGRCKAFAYCSRACQAEAWQAHHKPNCSKLLTDRSQSFAVEPAGELQEAVGRLVRLVDDLDRAWEWAHVRDSPQAGALPPGRLTADALVRDPAFTAFYAYAIPPELTYSGYPGEPDSKTIEHRLLLVARLFLMDDASATTPTERAALTRFLADPAHARAALTSSPPPPLAALISWDTYHQILEVNRDSGVRLHGPKLLAQPDALSAGEYTAAVAPMCAFWVVQHAQAGGEDEGARKKLQGKAERWNELGMLFRVALLHGFLDVGLARG